MAEINVLWIDDAPNHQLRKLGQTRRQLIETAVKGFCSLHVASTAEEVVLETGPRRLRTYSAVILDVDLSEMNGVNFAIVINRIRDVCPVIIVSNRWSEGIVSLLQAAFDKKTRVCDIIDLSQLTDLNKAVLHIRTAVADATGAIRLTEDNGVSYDRDTCLRILHISDPQFGGVEAGLAKIQWETLPEMVRKCCPALRTPSGRKHFFLAVTGDIAETGRPEEYEVAYSKIGRLFEALADDGLPSDRIFLVPGNHDMHLGLANANRLYPVAQGTDPAPETSFSVKSDADWDISNLTGLAFNPFFDFAYRVTEDHRWLTNRSETWVWETFCSLGILLIGTNTSARVGLDGWYIPEFCGMDRMIQNIDPVFKNRGVQPKAEPNSGSDINEGRSVDPLYTCLLMHHPIRNDSKWPKQQVENPQVFNALNAAFPIDMVLCGHLHKHKDPEDVSKEHWSSWQVLSSTVSLHEDRRDGERGVNIIELSREGGIVTKVKVIHIPINDDGVAGHPKTTKTTHARWE